MTRLLRTSLAVALLFLCRTGLPAAEPADADAKDPRVLDRTLPDLSEFKTVETAVTTRISRAIAPADVQPGYLGVNVEVGPQGKLVVVDVEPESPAAKAGLQPGDVIRTVGGQEFTNPGALRDALLARAADEPLALSVLRKDQTLELTA